VLNDLSAVTVYDEFVLGGPATVTSLIYYIFARSPLAYNYTNVSLFNGSLSNTGPTGEMVIPTFSAIGTGSSNNLTSTNAILRDGFKIELSGLSLILDPGTYTLGFSTVMNITPPVAQGAAIGYGGGSSQTIGSGLYQTGTTSIKQGAHVAFTVIGETGISVPEPTTLALVAAALLTLAISRRGTSC
jgi:hypothetical protein